MAKQNGNNGKGNKGNLGVARIAAPAVDATPKRPQLQSKGAPLGVTPKGPPKTKAGSNAEKAASTGVIAGKPGSDGKRKPALIVSPGGKTIKEPAGVAGGNGVGLPGGRKAIAGMSDEEKKKQIASLLEDLAAETDSENKKSIRRQLRARGHYGGLGGKGGPTGQRLGTRNRVVSEVLATAVATPAAATPSPSVPAKGAVVEGSVKGKRAKK